MKVEPLVSIIVAVLNGGKTLQAAIDSIHNQTYENKELIVFDGLSTDNTVDIIKKNTDKIDYWKSEADRGVFHAWNKALDVAKGDYICFIGADDRYATNSTLCDMLNTIKDGALPDIISGKICLVDADFNELSVGGKPWDWTGMKSWMVVAHPGLLHHRSLFDRFGGFNESYRVAGDYEFLLRLGRETTYEYLSEVVVLMGNGGVSNNQLLRVFAETREIHCAHPEIGVLKAWFNFSLAIMATVKRYLMLRR